MTMKLVAECKHAEMNAHNGDGEVDKCVARTEWEAAATSAVAAAELEVK